MSSLGEELAEKRVEIRRGQGEPAVGEGAPQQLTCDAVFETPVALEVQARAVEDERADHGCRLVMRIARSGACPQDLRPANGIGPRKRVHRVRLRIVDNDGFGHGLNDDAHVPEQRGARGQSGTEQDLGLHSIDAPRDHTGNLDRRCLEHAGLDERRQQHDLGTQQRGRRRHVPTSRPPSRSLSSVTSAGGTRQVKTP